MKNAKGLGPPLWLSPADSNGDLCERTDRWLAFAKIVSKADFD
jgi:hypothetical protein